MYQSTQARGYTPYVSYVFHFVSEGRATLSIIKITKIFYDRRLTFETSIRFPVGVIKFFMSQLLKYSVGKGVNPEGSENLKLDTRTRALVAALTPMKKLPYSQIINLDEMKEYFTEDCS